MSMLSSLEKKEGEISIQAFARLYKTGVHTGRMNQKQMGLVAHWEQVGAGWKRGQEEVTLLSTPFCIVLTTYLKSK